MAPPDAPGRQVGRDAAAFGRPGAVVKNSAFRRLPLNVCQRFFASYRTRRVLATGY